MQLLYFFTKWQLAAILDDRKSLLIASLAISDQNATFIFWIFFKKYEVDQCTIFFIIFSQNGRQCQWPFWFSDFLQNR